MTQDLLDSPAAPAPDASPPPAAETEPRMPWLVRMLTAEPLVMAVLLVNAVVYLVQLGDFPQLQQLAPWVRWVDFGCVLYFVVECALKLSALGPAAYFASHWRKFEFAVVLASLPVLTEPFFPDGGLFSAFLVLRLARVLRVLRMVHYLNAAPALIRLQGPIYLLVVIGLVRLFIDEASWLSSSIQGVVRDATAILLGLTLGLLAARTYAVFDAVYLQPLTRTVPPRLDGLMLEFLRVAATVVSLVAGFVLGLQNAGHDPYAVLTGIGIGGMAIAFAAQEAIANVISGLILFVQRPFRIGDQIQAGGVAGKVHMIGLRAVTLETWNRERIAVPNRQLIGGALTNVDSRRFHAGTTIVRLPLDTPPDRIDRAVDILRGISNDHPQLGAGMPARLKSIGEWCLELELRFAVQPWRATEAAQWDQDWRKEFELEDWVNREAVRRLTAEGFTFAVRPG